MNTHVRPLCSLTASWICYLAQQGDHSELLEQRGVERNLVQAIENFAGSSGRAGAFDGINGDKKCVLRFTLADERRDCRVAGIAAVPIWLSVDFDSLKQRRQTGRGQKDLGRNLGVAENAPTAGSNAGRGPKQADRGVCDCVEVDRVGQSLLRGVGSSGIQLRRLENA